MARHAGTAEPTEYCAACDEWHSIAKPVHRRPIRRLLAKQAALEEQVRRLKATLAQRVETIRKLTEASRHG